MTKSTISSRWLMAGLGMMLLLSSSIATAAWHSHADQVRVLYAGSLAHVMEDKIQPAFERVSTQKFRGEAGGSDSLAHKIRDKVSRADVFISANPDVNKRLMGKDDGHWVKGYMTLMTSPLVLGYHPDSPIADQLSRHPWHQVISQQGIRIGRTDEELDPKGDYTIKAIKEIAEREKKPELAEKILDNSSVYPEEGLVGRLQSGQLDAGFFYRGEAAAAGIKTVAIRPVKIGATYTIAILDNAENRKGAREFARFLMSKQGRRILEANGFDMLSKPRGHGDTPDLSQALDAATDSDP